MSTERDEHGIYHIDGPAYRGFAINDGKGNRIEVIYHNFVYRGRKDECEEAYASLMNLICSELLTRAEKEPTLLMPVIWWRRRVEFSKSSANPWEHQFYCRFATTPALPDEVWQRWETPECGPPRNAREACG